MNYKIYTVFESTDIEFTGNMKEIAYYFHINYNTLNYKINYKYLTIEEAILLPLNCIRQDNLIYKNNKGSIKELCKI